jgi:hypothetical protein
MVPERPKISCGACEQITCKGFATDPNYRQIEDKDGEVIGKIATRIAECGVLNNEMTEAYFLWLINWDRSEDDFQTASDLNSGSQRP